MPEGSLSDLTVFVANSVGHHRFDKHGICLTLEAGQRNGDHEFLEDFEVSNRSKEMKH